MTTQKVPNRLAKEKSPYLLQHAHNPVNWFPWSDEAFDKAKQEKKPIFLSIGYSTCHWCHVMERESFEDDEIAELLNRDYIAIKVDREERPDVDQVYMTVCQAMTGQGGWPLTVIMTPDKKPFFAGTYYPKRRKYGRYGLMEILDGLAEKWREDREEVQKIAERVVEQLSGSTDVADDRAEGSERAAVEGMNIPVQAKEKAVGADLSTGWIASVLEKTFSWYERAFDPVYGGFGGAPKFPTSHNLSLLLRYFHQTGDDKGLKMVEKTLDAMRRGGIYDHVGFGFSRYSTDERWLVPHFEKMLYDNALLAMTYTEAYQLTGKDLYAQTVKEIFAYIARDMTDTGGAFYSAEDADSEGVEGKFYVWTPDEVTEVLGQEKGGLYCDLFEITRQGNFEGSSIPNRIDADWPEYAQERGISEQELRKRLEAARQKLFEHREQRIHPHKDDKILTSWNGLMIMALAKGAKAFDEPKFAEAAERAAGFILKRLVREDGRLLARYREGEAAYPAYLDDYAFLSWGLVELYEATGRAEYLEQASGLVTDMLRLFWDERKGGFFFTGNDGETLFMRPKEIYDGALPAGNSAALLVLAKLARYRDSEDWRGRAEQLLAVFADEVEQYPAGHSLFLAAAHAALNPGKEIIIAGEADDPTVQDMLAESRRRYAPDDLIVFHPPGEEGEAIRGLCPLTQDKLPVEGKATAYVCEQFACQAPATDYATFLEVLG